MTVWTLTPVPTTRLTTSVVAYATVPVGMVWVVRQVVATNASSTASSRVRLLLWGVGGGDRTIDHTIAPVTTEVFDLRARLNAGDVIRASSSVADTINLTVTVWQFVGP